MFRSNSNSTRFAWVCLIALNVVACQRSESAVLVSAQRERTPEEPPSTPGERPVTTTRAKTVTVEFEPPPEFFAPPVNGKAVVTAFQVGFFGSQSELVRAIEMPRDSARVAGAKVLLDVPLIPVASRTHSAVTIRVRALSAGPLGAWSAPAGAVSLPVLEPTARAGRNTDRPRANREARRNDSKGSAPNRNGRQPNSTDMLDRHSVLKATLIPLLDDGLSAEEAAGAFADLQELATAVVLSTKLNLPMSRICKAMRAAPNTSLADALVALQPSVDAAKEIKAASPQARRLVNGRPPRPSGRRQQ
jgi:hypothetical protein